jgi:hypothetical protein
VPIQPQTKKPVATNPPVKRAAQPQKYFTFNPADPRSHLKIKKGQEAAFAKDLGWYAAPSSGKPLITQTRVVKKATTPQNSFTSIESPAQIEERVKRMAQESYSRQETSLNDQADRLRKEAEGRRTALQAAYAQAAKLNAGFGADVQNGWEQAAHTITGLAGTAVGGVQDALKADLASQEQALSRVGAGGTGFDATSQGQTEYFRGGGIPGEYDTRMGGIGRQWMNEAAKSLADRGLQEGIINENTDRAKIRGDLADQISTLTAGRTKEESDLRTQLLGARQDQIKAIQDQQQFDASLAIKKVQIEQAQQKINQQYQVALANANTSADRAAVYRWKANQDAILSAARNGIAQQNADAHMISANASATRAANANDPKAATQPQKRMAIKTAQTEGAKTAAQVIRSIALATPNINPPAGYDTKNNDWTADPKYISAKKEAQRRATLNFGTVMYRTINVIGSYLKEIGYTPTQIKRMAYNIVSPLAPAPVSWLQKNPGFGPKV